MEHGRKVLITELTCDVQKLQKETNWWYSLVIDVKCSWHTVADNMFSIINMIIIIIWQYSTYSCECVKRLFISLIKANCICSLFDWGRAGLLVTTKKGGGRVRVTRKTRYRARESSTPVYISLSSADSAGKITPSPWLAGPDLCPPLIGWTWPVFKQRTS